MSDDQKDTEDPKPPQEPPSPPAPIEVVVTEPTAVQEVFTPEQRAADDAVRATDDTVDWSQYPNLQDL